MNAQNTASVVNLISAQPAKSSAASGAPDSSAPRFADVLGNQRNTQSAAAQGGSAHSASQQSSSNANTTDSGSATTAQASTDTAAKAAQSGEPDRSGAHESDADKASDQNQAALQALQGNETALAMSNLAIAVAQVQLARTQATTDGTEVTGRPLVLTNADASTQARNTRTDTLSATATNRQLNDANLVASAGQASAQTVSPKANDALTPRTDAAADPILGAQSARDTGKRSAAVSLASLNQRADHLDRQARLNANARDFLADKATPEKQGFDKTLGLIQNSTDTDGDKLTGSKTRLGLDNLPIASTQASASPVNDRATGALPFTLNTVASSAAPVVSTPLGHPQWGNDFSQQVANVSQSVKQGLQSIELRLDPPDLGPIRISINMNDGVAQAMFVSPHAAVRSAVENALPQLQQQLAQAGISLGQTSVSDQGQAQQETGNNGQSGGNRHNTVASAAGTVENSNPVTDSRPQSTHNGQVDTFA